MPIRFFMLGLGTRGDVALLVTLGTELRRRGHQVTLASSAFYESLIRGAGIDFVPGGPGTERQHQQVLERMGAESDARQRTLFYFSHWLKPQWIAAQQSLSELAGTAEFFISNLKVAISVNGRAIPAAFITYDAPASAADFAKYAAASQGGLVLEVSAFPSGFIVGSDQWPATVLSTGFWHPPATRWHPPEPLANFLSAGSAPIVVTQGSMRHANPERILRALMDALGTEKRAVIIGNIPNEWRRPNVCCVTETPYDWLFPRAAAIVHHGSYGATAAALRACRPSIVMPQITAQHLLAQTLMAHHLASGVIDSAHATAAAFCAALHAADDASISAALERWRGAAAVNGAAIMADTLETHYRSVQAA